MPDMCAPALALPDGPKSGPLKLTWNIHSRYRLKQTLFERAYLVDINLQIPDMCAPALLLPDSHKSEPEK